MWAIEFDAKVDKEMARLAPKDRQRILRFLKERVAPLDNPRNLGEALAGPLSGYWKYRVGDYRVIARFENRAMVILVVRIGNRRQVYRWRIPAVATRMWDGSRTTRRTRGGAWDRKRWCRTG